MHTKRYIRYIWDLIDTDNIYCSPVELQWDQFLRCCKANYAKVRNYYEDKDGNHYYRYIFTIDDIDGRVRGPLNLEVFTEETKEQLTRITQTSGCEPISSPTLFVSTIPNGVMIDDIIEDISSRAYIPIATDLTYSNKVFKFYEFNFESIDGDHFGAIPGINKDGKFELFGDALSYLHDMDRAATRNAYCDARNVGIIECSHIE